MKLTICRMPVQDYRQKPIAFNVLADKVGGVG